MDFRNLTDAECGTTNTVLQLTSHLAADHTFLESHGFQTFSSEADQLVEQFLQEARAVPQAFQMDGLLQEMREIESQRFAMPPVPASRVKDHLNDDIWAQQYLQDGRKFEPCPNHEEIWAQYNEERASGMHELGLGEDWARGYLEQANNNMSDEALEVQETANELLSTMDDSKFAYSKFMKFMNQVGDGKVIIEGGNVIGDIEDTGDYWAQEFAKNNKFEETLEENWATEFHEKRVTASEKNESDIWSKFHEQWKKLSDKDLSSDHPWLSEYANFYDPYKEYTFSEENPMTDIKDPLKVGKEKLLSGDLPGAVLCFETAAKQTPENSEAWQLLGVTQAENEQDPNAICALKRCLQLDPTNLPAMLALSVSYTNENYQNQACQTLANWLKNNPKYSNLVPANYNFTESVPPFLSQEKHKEIEDMFIRAVQRNPNEVDYEVQCCLGVLFNLSGDYDKAVDCFRTALQVKPDDSRLWNRLGATLANGNRSEEAVDAYHNALQLSPGFIRARYNIGITCINLDAYREAAEHFLIALNQQAQGRDISNLQSVSQMSDTIWSTLRMSIGLMNRPDLKILVNNKDLNKLNKAFDITEF